MKYINNLLSEAWFANNSGWARFFAKVKLLVKLCYIGNKITKKQPSKEYSLYGDL
jgi:hypothetical protein